MELKFVDVDYCANLKNRRDDLHPNLFAVGHVMGLQPLITCAEEHHSREQNQYCEDDDHLEVELFIWYLQIFAAKNTSAETSRETLGLIVA
jgi:hypothetical protein